jgi:hypothetical protein
MSSHPASRGIETGLAARFNPTKKTQKSRFFAVLTPHFYLRF